MSGQLGAASLAMIRSGMSFHGRAQLLRVIRPTGIAIFQIPSHSRYRSANRKPLVRVALNVLPSQWREEYVGAFE
jgi:hypothetical protein